MPEKWRYRQSHAIGYHPGHSGRGGDYIYNDPWRSQKIDKTSARARAWAKRVTPYDLECGWVHLGEDVERTMRDDSGDYHSYYGWPHGHFGTWVARTNQEGMEAIHVDTSVSS